MKKDIFAVADFAERAHEGQCRKYTGEDYYSHPLEVASIVGYELHKSSTCYYIQAMAVALCHDIIEDTIYTARDILDVYRQCFTDEVSASLVYDVLILTEKYTHEEYPDMNRAARKAKEADRIAAFGSEIAQSVKIADMISNAPSILKYDPKFGEVYRQECIYLASKLDKADKKLLDRLNLILK